MNAREDAYRDEVLGEVVAWLVKKAREHRAKGPQYAKQADVIGKLASQVQRGAVRPDNLATLPPGEEPAPEDVPALRAEVARLRAELANRPTRDVVLREAAADLTNGERPSGACTRCGEPSSAWCPHCAGCACPDGRAEAHAPGGSCPTAPAAEAGAA